MLVENKQHFWYLDKSSLNSVLCDEHQVRRHLRSFKSIMWEYSLISISVLTGVSVSSIEPGHSIWYSHHKLAQLNYLSLFVDKFQPLRLFTPIAMCVRMPSGWIYAFQPVETCFMKKYSPYFETLNIKWNEVLNWVIEESRPLAGLQNYALPFKRLLYHTTEDPCST